MTNRAIQFASAVGLPFMLMAGAADANTSTKNPQAFPQDGARAYAPYGLVAFCRYLKPHQVANWKHELAKGNHRKRPECTPAPESRPDRFTTDRGMQEGRANLYTLDFVQKFVNDTVAPETDQMIHGVDEHWGYPGYRGDCEDYVLFKRLILAHLGEYLRNKPGAHARITARGDGLLPMFKELVKRFKDMGANMELLKNNTITERSLSIARVLDEKGEGHAILLARRNNGTHLVLDNKQDWVKEWADLPYSAQASSLPGRLLEWQNAY